MNNIHFLHPNLLFLLLLIIPMVAWYIRKNKKAQASLQISSLKGFSDNHISWKVRLRHFPFVLRCLSVAMLIIVIARPQSYSNSREIITEGIDIVMAMDISGSMEALDFRPNRLEAAKDVASKFIAGRENDRIGLVTFAGESFTQCPLTTDKAVLINLTHSIKMHMVKEGTAIGMGLATAVNRLRDSNAKSKVIILLTDGENNSGEIAPLAAAEIAKKFNIRIYTIGVGSIGVAKVPIQTPYGIQTVDQEVKIDEPMLRDISKTTGGKYFRATNKSSLKNIYSDIDKLEKSKIEEKKYSNRKEEFLLFALLAILFVISEILLKNSILRSIP